MTFYWLLNATSHDALRTPFHSLSRDAECRSLAKVPNKCLNVLVTLANNVANPVLGGGLVWALRGYVGTFKPATRTKRCRARCMAGLVVS